MKTLIISDIHLGKRICQRKLRYLHALFNSADQIILNGDFWDKALISFDDFLHSAWSELFPVLYRKETIYLYGNHDPAELMDKRTALFSRKKSNSYFLTVGKTELQIEHGHRLVQGFERVSAFFSSQFLDRNGTHLINMMEGLGVRALGVGFKKFFPHRWLDYCQLKRKIRKKSVLQDERIHILGHLHIDLDCRHRKYIVTGGVNHGHASFVWIEDDQISLVSARY